MINTDTFTPPIREVRVKIKSCTALLSVVIFKMKSSISNVSVCVYVLTLLPLFTS